ncbi:hypothetical protein ST201phi2-1p112 [Pseudomonas phage 201phi2-1]|uniref:Uncharacterized protein n=1 Tax=Pseudomonas phage 201phi2-1 TaxID=198110 RepID=B3FIX5_BP201|nr:hypothetical protein ST201phi2-1p112 [Pseudomonas phage 201phi2-1]ABY62944.1 hypothetical protein 201phi2-1p112 [Pseudomonas phage 201phi2-1]
MIRMYEDFTIRKAEKGWQLETYSGNYPITVKLVGNGWSVPNIWSDGPARLSYDLVFEAYAVEYTVNVDTEDQTVNYVTVDGKEVSSIKVGSNYPVTQLFHVTTPDGVVPIRERVSRL